MIKKKSPPKQNPKPALTQSLEIVNNRVKKLSKSTPVNTLITDTVVDHMLFEQASKMNDDQAYWFKLRGNTPNPFIDCATPLIGMVLRIRNQQTPVNDLQRLYRQCVSDIKAIESELAEAQHEYVTIIAFRYVLCTFVDEAIMSTEWGSESEWSSKSLLVHFHNETWGGEKTYQIIERLTKEIDRYFELLEFMLLCLCLGFRGRFKVMNQGEERHDKVVSDLYEKLKELNGWENDVLTSSDKNIVHAPYYLMRDLSTKKVIASVVITIVLIYFFYLLILNWRSDVVVNQVDQLLYFL